MDSSIVTNREMSGFAPNPDIFTPLDPPFHLHIARSAGGIDVILSGFSRTRTPTPSSDSSCKMG